MRLESCEPDGMTKHARCTRTPQAPHRSQSNVLPRHSCAVWLSRPPKVSRPLALRLDGRGSCKGSQILRPHGVPHGVAHPRITVNTCHRLLVAVQDTAPAYMTISQ